MKVLLLSLGLAAALSSQARLPRGPRARELESASAALGVRAPWNAPKWVWKRAYRSHRALLPLLHFRDACRPADANVNLLCLWWKALDESRRRPAAERVSRRMLPPSARWLVARPLCWLYPRLHHQNVALRTAFLDRALADALAGAARAGGGVERLSVVVLGAGFDARALRADAAGRAAGRACCDAFQR